MATNNLDRVRRLAVAAHDALGGMSPRERQLNPSPDFLRNYNRLRRLAARSAPDVPRGAWPPMAESDARYIEVRSYLAQVVALLSDEPWSDASVL